MSAAIRTTALTKRYGEKAALDSVDLVVEEGSVFGFLGPNGAGKTTTLRMLTGLAGASHQRSRSDPRSRRRVGGQPGTRRDRLPARCARLL
ncbi:MAG TPA: ATP-binding cassette domain-containing protein [Dermatophilaceae bacterium]